MQAVMWHEQVKLDDTDRSVLNDGPCVVQLTVDKRSASEMKVAAAKGMSRKRRLMLDSGCGIDLIGYSDLSSEERNMISDVAKLTLRTANGKTSTRGVAHMIVDGIEELIEAHVLESTPSLLSLGKRCLEHGYCFVWEPFAEPKFYDPHGAPVRIEVINNIPYLIPSETIVFPTSIVSNPCIPCFLRLSCCMIKLWLLERPADQGGQLQSHHPRLAAHRQILLLEGKVFRLLMWNIGMIGRSET